MRFSRILLAPTLPGSSIGFLLLLFVVTGCQPDVQTIQDSSGNIYATQTFGDTQWMLENLRTQKDAQGSPILFYYPNDDSSLTDQFGLLYDYETACQLCPEGWELPTHSDWEALFQFAHQNQAGPYKDSQAWEGENNSNATGFSVRPTGYGNSGEFDNFFGSRTLFWSKTDHAEHIWTYIFEAGADTIRKAEQHPTYGFSVRCIHRNPTR